MHMVYRHLNVTKEKLDPGYLTACFKYEYDWPAVWRMLYVHVFVPLPFGLPNNIIRLLRQKMMSETTNAKDAR